MKSITPLLIIILSIYSNPTLADQQQKNIQFNKAVDLCISKYGENNDECLGDITEKSESLLKEAFNQKLKELESFDYTQWWMGSEQQKSQMIVKFKSSQKIWINYRTIFCQSAITSAKNTHNLGNAITGCELNMNARRIEEISLMTPGFSG